MHRPTAVFAALTCLAALAVLSAAEPTGRTVRLLAIGNSFSNNATTYLAQIAQAQGDTLVLGSASIGGCSLEKHWTLAELNEAKPDDPEGRQYYLAQPGGGSKRVGLKEMLLSQPWDVVTIQQHSLLAIDLPTYRPYAAKLAAYVRRNAPQAKLWVHETWAYRADDQLMKKKGMTQAQMYARLHDNYTVAAKEVAADGIIPTATAFQNARQDPRWQLEVEQVADPKAFTYPKVPRQAHNLCVGWHWDTQGRNPAFVFDGKHCTPAGKYLGGMVWYAALFGEGRKPVFVPPDLSREDAEFLAGIAERTVRGGLLPRELTGQQAR